MTNATMKVPRSHRAALVAVPWLFLMLFAAMFTGLVWPRATDGHVVAMIVSAIMAIGFVCSSAAAITFSRDVIVGRYPSSGA
jgi:hypothetical protein